MLPEKPTVTVDPLLMSGLISTALAERNPFKLLQQEVSHQVKTLLNLGKNRAACQAQIEALQHKVSAVEGMIATASTTPTGHRLDKFR